MTRARAGVRVLVTRPAEQARALARRIQAEGGEAVVFPVLTIEPEPDLAAVRAAIGPVRDYDVVVFVSPNAVAHGHALLDAQSDRAPRIAAIGPSTALALEARGVTVTIRPAAGYTSETLLAEPGLRELRGQRALIVRGGSGRELLAETLRARGATVAYADVYRRVAEHADAAALRARWRSRGIDLVTALSVETLDAIRSALGDEGHALLSAAALVTASDRVIKRAAALGLSSVVQARGPDDAALVEAMIAWRRARSDPSG